MRTTCSQANLYCWRRGVCFYFWIPSVWRHAAENAAHSETRPVSACCSSSKSIVVRRRPGTHVCMYAYVDCLFCIVLGRCECSLPHFQSVSFDIPLRCRSLHQSSIGLSPMTMKGGQQYLSIPPKSRCGSVQQTCPWGQANCTVRLHGATFVAARVDLLYLTCRQYAHAQLPGDASGFDITKCHCRSQTWILRAGMRFAFVCTYSLSTCPTISTARCKGRRLPHCACATPSRGLLAHHTRQHCWRAQHIP